MVTYFFAYCIIQIFFPLGLCAMEKGVSCSEVELNPFAKILICLTECIEKVEISYKDQIHKECNQYYKDCIAQGIKPYARDERRDPLQNVLNQKLLDTYDENNWIVSTICGGHFRALEEALTLDPTLIEQAFNDKTPLMHAAGIGHTQLLEWLLGHKADVAKENTSGQTVLHIAYDRCFGMMDALSKYSTPRFFMGDFETCVEVLRSRVSISTDLTTFKDVSRLFWKKKRKEKKALKRTVVGC